MKNIFSILVLSTVLVSSSPAQDTIMVSKGWNVIGSLFSGAVSDGLGSSPCAIITTPVYRYRPGIGYQQVDTLRMGEGYWIKASRDGMIIFGVPYGGPPCPADSFGASTFEYYGKTYTTVQIGSQRWMKENLDVGTRIQAVDTASNNGTIEKYCYNDSTVNCELYGGMYQWNEAMQYLTTEGAQGICPYGYHIPTLDEIQSLSSAVGGDGNALKAVGEGYQGGVGSNSSGFTALLAGTANRPGTFAARGGNSFMWSSTENYPSSAINLMLYYHDAVVYHPDASKETAVSVRCIAD